MVLIDEEHRPSPGSSPLHQYYEHVTKEVSGLTNTRERLCPYYGPWVLCRHSFFSVSRKELPLYVTSVYRILQLFIGTRVPSSPISKSHWYLLEWLLHWNLFPNLLNSFGWYDDLKETSPFPSLLYIHFLLHSVLTKKIQLLNCRTNIRLPLLSHLSLFNYNVL